MFLSLRELEYTKWDVCSCFWILDSCGGEKSVGDDGRGNQRADVAQANMQMEIGLFVGS